MSSTLSAASTQWANRPADERFTSLHTMGAKLRFQRDHSKQVVLPSRKLEVRPDEANEMKGLKVFGANGVGYAPTHWAFGQLASLTGAPAGYLRTIPAPLAADCINFGMQFERDNKDAQVYLQKTINEDGTTTDATIRAVTGPNYGRIYNSDVVDSLISHFGDGITGDFRVPGEFGKAVTVNKANTTLYASDRDMFVFLADEINRVEIPNRRDGQSGSLARGFFIRNSEVGNATFDIETFFFDYACMNRTVWGVEGYKAIKLRHTASAPDKFMDEIAPALLAYRNNSTTNIVESVKAAQAARIDDVPEFLFKRFSKGVVAKIQATHLEEEQRPIETLWDASVAITAHAKSIVWQDERVAMERIGGGVLDLVKAN